MALVKIKDFDTNYREALGDDSIIGFTVYTDATDEKIGTVKDILVDEKEGKFRYLVVDIGFWIFGKEVLLPIGLSRISFTDERIYARSLIPICDPRRKTDRVLDETVAASIWPESLE